MVGQIIPTSAWAHNCGMHAIADYLIEQIQKDDFESKFSNPAYDRLLNSFRNAYKQENLSWAQIREASIRSTRIDGQIIWGYPLRKILPEILKQNTAYKKDFYPHFSALLELLVQNKTEEAQNTYPILLLSNELFLKNKAIKLKNADGLEQARQHRLIRQYYNHTGFDNYCKTILEENNEEDLYIWLGIDELTIFCNYFGISAEFNSYRPVVENNQNKLYFVNSGEHWERAIHSAESTNLDNKTGESAFYRGYLIKGRSCFVANANQMAKIFFTEKYLEFELFSAFSNASLTEQNLYFEKTFKDGLPEKMTMDAAIKLSFDYAQNNKDRSFLYLPAQKFLLNKIQPANMPLSVDSYKLIEAALEHEFSDWVKNIVECLEKNPLESALIDLNQILELCAKQSCTAISNNDKHKLWTCLSAEERILAIPGQLNLLHHAFKNNQIEWLKDNLIDFYTKRYPVGKEIVAQQFYILCDKSKDEYDRNLTFRMDRVKTLNNLHQQLEQSSSFTESLSIRTKISSFYLNEARIYAVDKHYEKSKHTAKIQSKKISTWGYPAMLAVRSAGVIADGGVIRFGLEMARPYLPTLVQVPFTFVGGKIASYAGPKLGLDTKESEEYTKMIMGNLVSFALMPQYYVASTVLGGVVYYTFKNSGYDNLEAIVNLATDAAALGISNDLQNKTTKNAEAYEYQLNKNLTPFFGDYSADYVAPVVSYLDQKTQQFDGLVQYPVTALCEQLSPYYSNSMLSQMVGVMGESVKMPMEVVKSLQNYKNSWIESAFNLIEGKTLGLMGESKFKSERLHAIKLYRTHELQQKVDGLSEKATEQQKVLTELQTNLDKETLTLAELKNQPDLSPDVLSKQENLVAILQNQVDVCQIKTNELNTNLTTQTESLNQAYDQAEDLFEKTEGFAYSEKMKDAFLAYHDSLVKFNASSSESAKLKLAYEKALVESQFYNTNHVNQSLASWAKGIETLYSKYNSHFPNGASPAKYIDAIIDKGFKLYSDRNQLAKFISDEIIKLKYPFYPDIGDTTAIEAERQLLLHEICTDELSGYASDTKRSKNRLFDYFFAKVTNTEKKRHHHRWERITKPFLNEISNGIIGWKPFKDFNGGDERPGRAGVQFTYGSDGHSSVHITAGENQSIYTVYDSKEKQAQIISSIPQPLPSKSVVPVNNQAQLASNQPTAIIIEEEPSENYSCLNVDNPSVQPFLTALHDEVCAKINKLGEDKKAEEKISNNKSTKPTSPKTTQPKATQSKEAEKPKLQEKNIVISKKITETQLPAKTPKAVVFSKSTYKLGDNPFLDKYKVEHIPPKELVKIAGKALKEFSVEFIEGMAALGPMLYEDMLGPIKGKNAAKLTLFMTKYFSKEVANIFKNEKTQTRKLLETSLVNYEKLSEEEKTKEGFKLVYSCVPVGLLAKATGKGALLIKKINTFADKVPVPTKVVNPVPQLLPPKTNKLNDVALKAPAKTTSKGFESVSKPQTPKVLANSPKGSQNLGQLGSKQLVVTKGITLNSPSKMFTQNYDLKSTTLTSGLKQIEAFSVKAALDGALYPKDKLPILVSYLDRRGVHVYGTNKSPVFRAKMNGPSQIYWPENPTILQVKHELAHWLDFKELGFDNYAKLSTYQRENLVLKRLQNNRIWEELNQLEKDFSINYVKKIKEGYKPGGL